jgi:hypothetical protein
MCAGISSTSRLLTLVRTSLGAIRRGASARGSSGWWPPSRGDALVGHVADDDADLAAGQLEEVVEVAADLAGRAVEGRELPAAQVGQLLGQELLLDQLGDPQLLLDPLTLADLGLLLADQLGDPHGRGGVAGQVVEQLAVVG